EPLTYDDCLQLLRQHVVGRIAVVLDDGPIVVPVNYRLVETAGRTWVAFRTRPGNVLDHAGAHVAFEIDGIDVEHESGWSVVVRGMLHRVDAAAAGFDELFDPHPWITKERDRWLVVEPFAITGRRLD